MTVSSQENKKSIEYAGFFRRTLAYLIDCSLFIVPAIIIQFFIFNSFFIDNNSNVENILGILGDKLSSLMFFLYICSVFINLVFVLLISFFLSSKWQATPGKRLLKFYIEDINHKKLSFKQALFRSILPFILLFVINGLMTMNIIKFERYRISSLELIIQKNMPEIYEDFKKSEMSSISDYMDDNSNREKINKIESLFSPEQKYALDLSISLRSKNLREQQITNSVKYLIAFFIYLSWYLVIFFNKENMTIHDFVLKTRAVKGRVNT